MLYGPRRSSIGCAALAQLVEHRIRNAGVASSSLAGGTTPTPYRLYRPQGW